MVTRHRFAVWQVQPLKMAQANSVIIVFGTLALLLTKAIFFIMPSPTGCGPLVTCGRLEMHGSPL